jgi:hypothetical protein
MKETTKTLIVDAVTAVISLAGITLVLLALAATIAPSWPRHKTEPQPEPQPEQLQQPHEHGPNGEHLGATHAAPRSGKWPAVRAAYIADHPACEACGATGSKAGLQVHHVKPFHLDPAKELDPANLITLCTSDSHNCHFFIGHALDWQAYNPHAREDAARLLDHIKNRRYELEPASKTNKSSLNRDNRDHLYSLAP